MASLARESPCHDGVCYDADMPAKRFITFEGGEGSGKSTQALLLANQLRSKGHEVVVTREPGGTPVAEKIRNLILADKPESPVAEFLLFAAARAEHVEQTIRPALKRKAIVICDRFIDSTRVYQGDLGHIDRNLIETVEKAAIASCYPAMTFILDVPAEISMARAASRGELNHYDSKHLSWHKALRTAFQIAALAEPNRCVLIDASGDQQPIAAAIWQAVSSRLDIEHR